MKKTVKVEVGIVVSRTVLTGVTLQDVNVISYGEVEGITYETDTIPIMVLHHGDGSKSSFCCEDVAYMLFG